MIRRFALFAALGLAVVAGPALAQQRPARAPAQPQLSPTERLNQMSLERARAGQDALQGGPDTTQNLNRISEDAARAGQNMNQAPLPFR